MSERGLTEDQMERIRKAARNLPPEFLAKLLNPTSLADAPREDEENEALKSAVKELKRLEEDPERGE